MRKKIFITLAAALLAVTIAFTTYNTVHIYRLNTERVRQLEHDVWQLGSILFDSMDLQEGKHGPLPYRIHVPEDMSEPLPLVLYLHHAGAPGDDNRRQLIESTYILKALLSRESRESFPCVFLAPQVPEGMGWVRQPWGPGMAEDVMALLEQISAQYNIDTSRIYVTGMSMGGFGTWGMLREYPDYFAAAVPICGGWDMDDDVANAPAMKDVPIWAFHGALDEAVPVERSRSMVHALLAVDGNIKYTEYPDEAHLIGDRVYSEPELLPWLFAQVKR